MNFDWNRLMGTAIISTWLYFVYQFIVYLGGNPKITLMIVLVTAVHIQYSKPIDVEEVVDSLEKRREEDK